MPSPSPPKPGGSRDSRPMPLGLYLIAGFVLVAVLPIALLLGLNEFSIRSRVRDETVMHMQVLARMASESVSAHLESVRNDLEEIAAVLDSPELPPGSETLLGMKLDTQTLVKSFLVISPDGYYRFAAPARPDGPGRYLGNTRIFDVAKTSRGPNYSDSRASELPGGNPAIISLASAAGYVVAAELDLEWISDWVGAATKGVGADILILDARGVPLADSNPGGGREPNLDDLSAVLESERGDSRGYRYQRDGERFVGISSPVTGSPWRTLISFREPDFDFLQTFIRTQVLLGGAAALVLSLIAAFFLNRGIRRSLTALLASARNIAYQSAPTEIRHGSPFAEMDELLAEFADMRKEVYRREEELKTALAGREMLLKEVHHRVKNNLQIVSSLLALQRERIENPEAYTALTESAQRVQSLSLVHEMLYQSSDFSTLNLSDYLLDFSHGLLSAYDAARDFDFQTSLEPMETDIDMAIPLGMCVNEILSNSLKYGRRTDGRRGSLRMQLGREGEGFLLEISDDGPGFDPTVARASGSLGLLLIDSLVSQVRGTLLIDTESGSRFEIQVPRLRSRD